MEHTNINTKEFQVEMLARTLDKILYMYKFKVGYSKGTYLTIIWSDNSYGVCISYPSYLNKDIVNDGWVLEISLICTKITSVIFNKEMGYNKNTIMKSHGYNSSISLKTISLLLYEINRIHELSMSKNICQSYTNPRYPIFNINSTNSIYENNILKDTYYNNEIKIEARILNDLNSAWFPEPPNILYQLIDKINYR